MRQIVLSPSALSGPSDVLLSSPSPRPVWNGSIVLPETYPGRLQYSFPPGPQTPGPPLTPFWVPSQIILLCKHPRVHKLVQVYPYLLVLLGRLRESRHRVDIGPPPAAITKAPSVPSSAMSKDRRESCARRSLTSSTVHNISQEYSLFRTPVNPNFTRPDTVLPSLRHAAT